MDGLTVKVVNIFFGINACEFLFESFVGKEIRCSLHRPFKSHALHGANCLFNLERPIVQSVQSEVLSNLEVVEIKIIGAVRPFKNFAELRRGDFGQVFNFDVLDSEFVAVVEKFFEEIRQLRGRQFLEAVDSNQHMKNIVLYAAK